tara:strand:+ start:8481 stop:9032 length:552 start_codon:yes stop_codon:yes gene_type:complete
MEQFDYELMEQEERPFARRLATWIVNHCLGPLTDLGAGTGVYVDCIQRHGWQAQGYDTADPQPKPDLVLQQSLFDVDAPANTVLCLEVAEHIDESLSDRVIQAVWHNTLPGGLVIWSAAQPGQGGVGHINCQLPDYWRIRARAQGFVVRNDLEHDLHAWITAGYHMGWFARNRQVWERPNDMA